jgi:hypothetical protein
MPAAAKIDPSVVIAGLDPAIHRIETIRSSMMDARLDPAHDESRSNAAGIREAA